MIDTKLTDEPGRLAALHRYEVLDTPREVAFDRITGLVKAIFDVPMALVTLIDGDRQWFKSSMGLDGTETARETSFCTHTIQTREPMAVPDARFAANPSVTGAPYAVGYLGVPLATPDGYNVGSLCVVDTKPRQFNATQVEMLKTFAAVVMDEMELRRIAAVDSLTGASTRRGFCVEVEKSLARFARHRQPSALVMFDLDHFKKVNDTYGHPAGDEVLRTVSGTIGVLLRSTDAFGRLGGEEFGVLLNDVDASQAVETAERLRRAIEAAVVPHDPPLKVTASFGVAPIGEGYVNCDGWLAAVDGVLYASKREGRNRVSVAG